MSGQGRRRWTNIKSALAQLSGILSADDGDVYVTYHELEYYIIPLI